MRLSDADRELLLERLKQHAALGAIDLEQLERRVEVVVRAETREQAAAAISDLPPLPDGPLPDGPQTGGPPPGASSPQQRPRARRGHGHADAPEPDWQPTGERFRDPRSGTVMRVWVDPWGARHYVVDDA